MAIAGELSNNELNFLMTGMFELNAKTIQF
jgi:hypothetical protein